MSAVLLTDFFRSFFWCFTHHIAGIEKEEHGNNPVECSQKQDEVYEVKVPELLFMRTLGQHARVTSETPGCACNIPKGFILVFKLQFFSLKSTKGMYK